LGASSCRDTTRPVAASQVTPSQAPQQSAPAAHVARMPVLSALMPALKPSSAARSAGEHGLLLSSDEDAFARA
jgi:hypothetical protein